MTGPSVRSSTITFDEKNQAGTEGPCLCLWKKPCGHESWNLSAAGTSAAVPEDVQKIWDTSPVKRSPAGWALRWVWDHPEVTVVLSGMNDEGHIDE